MSYVVKAGNEYYSRDDDRGVAVLCAEKQAAIKFEERVAAQARIAGNESLKTAKARVVRLKKTRRIWPEVLATVTVAFRVRFDPRMYEGEDLAMVVGQIVEDALEDVQDMEVEIEALGRARVTSLYEGGVFMPSPKKGAESESDMKDEKVEGGQ